MKAHTAELRDGSVVLIRPVQPGDAPLLAEGFTRLSMESRQLRFLTGKPSLSPAELRYFTEIDHHDHEALGALNPDDGLGLGIARYIRHVDDPEGAEVAVTVIDEWQDRGLGTELLKRLADRARQEGIHHFTALVDVDNDAVQALLRDTHADVRVIEREAGSIEYQIPLPARGLGDALYSVLRAFGRRQVRPPASIRDTIPVITPEDLIGHDQEPGS